MLHARLTRHKRWLARDSLTNCDDEDIDYDSMDDDIGLENDAEDTENFNEVNSVTI